MEHCGAAAGVPPHLGAQSKREAAGAVACHAQARYGLCLPCTRDIECVLVICQLKQSHVSNHYRI